MIMNGYKYKYNGKELQDELSLNLYDYGARNYDPAIGRWFNIDYYSEKYYPVSPYIYAINNDILFLDITLKPNEKNQQEIKIKKNILQKCNYIQLLYNKINYITPCW